jgi:hypothetical protein
MSHMISVGDPKISVDPLHQAFFYELMQSPGLAAGKVQSCQALTEVHTILTTHKVDGFCHFTDSPVSLCESFLNPKPLKNTPLSTAMLCAGHVDRVFLNTGRHRQAHFRLVLKQNLNSSNTLTDMAAVKVSHSPCTANLDRYAMTHPKRGFRPSKFSGIKPPMNLNDEAQR